MELKRLEKALSDRWVLIVSFAVLGVAAALIFGSVANSNQTSRYEATAAVRFVPSEGEIATLADEIAAAQSIATIAAGDLLDEQPDSRIVEDLANQRLTFVAQGSSREQAIERADALLQAYLSVDPEAGIPVEVLIADIEEHAEETQAAIDDLQPEPTSEALDLAASIAFIDAQITAIQERLVALVVEEAEVDSAGRSAIAAQRAFLNEELADLRAERTALGEVPDAELSTEEALMLAGLQARLESLTAEYQRLYLRQSGLAGEGSGVEATAVIDLTPAPIRPIVSAAIGLLGGLLIAVLGILFINRTRRPVWLAEDVRTPLLGNVPARRVSTDTSENWYDTAEPDQRKTSIQAIRAAIEAQVPATGATIGLTSLRVASEGVQAFAADLASSLASAGTSVLLLDANFDSRSPLGQFRVSGSSVSGVLALSPTAPEFSAQVRHAVEDAFRVRAGLSVIPSGPPPASPADALAGRQFRHLLSVAQEMYDVVVVVVDEVDRPAAQVAMQRLGYGLLVLTPGSPTIPDVDSSLDDMERLHIKMLGTVFLGKLRRLPRFGSRDESPAPQAQPVGPPEMEPASSPISRLQHYPIPEERSSAVVPFRSLDGLAVDVGATSTDGSDNFGTQLLEAIEIAEPGRASESVARYLVSQVNDMALARHGYGGLSPELIGAMSDYGFLSLKPLKGFRTAAGWLHHEVATEVGKGSADELMAAMERSLTRGEGSVRIDDWLTDEFFIRHVADTEGEPNVWHLVSPEGTVSILVPAHRLSTHHFELLLGEIGSRTVDELERVRSSLVDKADFEGAAVYEARISDVRQFERSILQVLGQGEDVGKRKGRAVAWRPDWSRGTRANLAPVQAAGLLPFSVLSPEEMSELLASA